MKKILVYIVSLSMLLSNNTMIMAAQTTSTENSTATTEENTMKSTATAKTLNKSTNISFDSSSLNTRIGHFKAYQFQGINPSDIDDISFNYDTEGILGIKQVQKRDSNGNEGIYYVPVAKKQGTVKVEAFIKLKNENEITAEATFKVDKVSSNDIVPLVSYDIYKGMEDKDGENADKDNDGQISKSEIQNVESIDVEHNWYTDIKVSDDDMQGVELAVNCKKLYLEGNDKITNLDFAKDMKQLKKVDFEGTSIPEKQQLTLLRLQPSAIKKGSTPVVQVLPKGIVYFGTDEENEEVDGILSTVTSEDSGIADPIVEYDELYVQGKTVGTTNLVIQTENANSVKLPITVEASTKDAVNIPDKYVLNAALESANKEDVGYLTKEDLKSVKSIYISNAKGKEVDLTGLEYATNLENIEIKNAKKINHIDQVKDLNKLDFLRLSGITNDDIQVMSQMANLKTLSISGSFKNIDGLGNLTNLTYLCLNSKEVDNINVIKNLDRLRTLDIEDCTKINDISALGKRKYEQLYVSSNIPADQILDYEDFRDVTVQNGVSLKSLEAKIDANVPQEDWEDEETFTYSADDKNVIDENGKAVNNGETDVTITVKGKEQKASKKIHVKVQDASNIEPAGETKDQLPTLEKSQAEDKGTMISAVFNNGNVYDLSNGGKKVESDAKSYVANYVYSGDNYFMLKTKISKLGELYTGLSKGNLQKQDFAVTKSDKNYFITNDKKLYRVNEKNQAEQIDENVEDILAFNYYSQKGKCLVLHTNGDLTEVRNSKFKVQNIKKIASYDYIVQNDGAMLYLNWYETDSGDKNITPRQATDTEMTTVQVYVGNQSSTYLMKDHTLYSYEEEKLNKIADNVKRVLPDAENVYEALNGEYYSFEQSWDDDDNLYYTTEKINCTDEKFTGITADGIVYIKGNKILTDVVGCKFYNYYEDAQYFMVRKDGTIWKYEKPYLAQKVLDYNGETLVPTPNPTPTPESTPEPTPTPTPAPEQKPTQGSSAQTQQIKVSQIKLSALSTKIAVGKKIKLTADITKNASNKTLKWTTSNSKVATVDKNGVVTIKKKAGGKTVKITAEATDGSGKKATFTIKVMKGVVKKVKISGKKTVKAGKTLKLKAKVTASKGANKKLKWTSSNPEYATVSASGKVKASKAGKKRSVKITAMATDGSGKKATVKIKIK